MEFECVNYETADLHIYLWLLITLPVITIDELTFT